MRFDEVPVTTADTLLRRTAPRGHSRRTVIRAALGTLTAASMGALQTVNAAVARAAYFNDWTSTSTGPCAPGNYASGHTEAGRKCGPSTVCSTCCFTTTSAGVNQKGWHREEIVSSSLYYTKYRHRPDQCWSSTYDSWRWKFSDGKTYRCSDGWRWYSNEPPESTSTIKTICPWSV